MEDGLGIVLIFAVLFSLATIILHTIAMWKIFEKAGWEGVWSLLLFIPIANIVILLVVAFSDSPSQKRQAVLSRMNPQGTNPPPPPV